MMLIEIYQVRCRADLEYLEHQTLLRIDLKDNQVDSRIRVGHLKEMKVQ